MAKGGHPTSGSAAVKKARHERKYGSRRQQQTEVNRRKKWKKHLREHPNYIRGIERMKESLGIA